MIMYYQHIIRLCNNCDKEAKPKKHRPHCGRCDKRGHTAAGCSNEAMTRRPRGHKEAPKLGEAEANETDEVEPQQRAEPKQGGPSGSQPTHLPSPQPIGGSASGQPEAAARRLHQLRKGRPPSVQPNRSSPSSNGLPPSRRCPMTLPNLSSLRHRPPS